LAPYGKQNPAFAKANRSAYIVAHFRDGVQEAVQNSFREAQHHWAQAHIICRRQHHLCEAQQKAFLWGRYGRDVKLVRQRTVQSLCGASSKKGHHEGVLLLRRVDKKDDVLF